MPDVPPYNPYDNESVYCSICGKLTSHYTSKKLSNGNLGYICTKCALKK